LALYDLKLSSKDNVILIIGNEGNGISKAIESLSDVSVYIPPSLDPNKIGKYPFNIVDSLNVGASAAIALYHITQQLKYGQ